MYTIEVERADLNIALLERDLQAMGGGFYAGLSARPGLVTAYLSDDADAGLLEAVRGAIRQHDAAQLTEEQAREMADKAALEAARSASREPVEPDEFAGNPLLMRLAAKVAWLEREIRDLRGL
jgi:hypothetical protein